MSTLTEQIAAFEEQKKQAVPAETLTVLDAATANLKATGIEGIAIKQGDAAPNFALQNHLGEKRSLTGMLNDSALVVSFYRGGW